MFLESLFPRFQLFLFTRCSCLFPTVFSRCSQILCLPDSRCSQVSYCIFLNYSFPILSALAFPHVSRSSQFLFPLFPDVPTLPLFPDFLSFFFPQVSRCSCPPPSFHIFLNDLFPSLSVPIFQMFLDYLILCFQMFLVSFFPYSSFRIFLDYLFRSFFYICHLAPRSFFSHFSIIFFVLCFVPQFSDVIVTSVVSRCSKWS